MERDMILQGKAEEQADDDMDIKLGAAKLLSYLREQEAGELHVETSSVYGVVIALPQISRSCGWPRGLTFVCLRGYLALILNLVVQLWLVYLLTTEDRIMDKFSGKMALCDFGANLASCPDGEGCIGPDGTKYTASRLYSFGAWSTRTFVRDSLRALFPNKLDEIDDHVDPGTYGMENPHCRFVCVLIFIMSLTSELNLITEGFRLMLAIPTKAESWVRYEKPSWAEKKEAKLIHGWTELELVKIKIAGMPLHWKVINVCLVLLPKTLLWFQLLRAGTMLLMNSSGIDDIIINSTALGFVLCIDELVFATLTSTQSRTILDKLETFPLYAVDHHEEYEDHEVLRLHEQNENDTSLQKKVRSMMRILPMNAILCFVIWAGSIMWYYRAHCLRSPDGTWVSQDIHLPKTVTLTLSQAFLPSFFSVPSEDEPCWSFPLDAPN